MLLVALAAFYSVSGVVSAVTHFNNSCALAPGNKCDKPNADCTWWGYGNPDTGTGKCETASGGCGCS